jgi:hypothetical protein
VPENGEKPDLKASAGKGGSGSFEWRAGMQALCLCLVRYRCFPNSQLLKGVNFPFPGGKNSPASTLDYVVHKSDLRGCWQINVFGYAAKHCRLKKYIKRRRTKRKGKIIRYKAEIQHDVFPQESIVIEVNGEEINGLEELQKLGDLIEDQWYETTGNQAQTRSQRLQ